MTTKLLFKLLPVQILLACIGSINGIVSSLFAGNFVGTDAMSAIGCYNPLNLLIGSVSFMVLSGSAILCGKYMGKNRSDKVQDVFSLSCMLSVLISAVFIPFLLILSIFDFSGFLTKDPVVRVILNQYLLGQALGIFPLVLGNQLTVYLSLENKVKRTVCASLANIVVNIALNFLFVQQMKMEALGLALASSVGMWVFCLIQGQYFITKRSFLRFAFRREAWKDAAGMLRTGIPGAANTGYQAIRGYIVNMLVIAFVGSIGLSAFTAANTLLGIVWAVPTGMQNVCRMLISISVGEEDRETLTDTVRTAFFRYIPLMCAVCAAVIALAVPLTRLYYRDVLDPVYMMTVWGFRILPLCMPLALFRMILECCHLTMDRNLMVNILEALDGFVSVCVFSAILIPAAGLNGLYIANVLNGIVSVIYLVGYSVRGNRHFPKDLEELIVIPPGFGVPEEERMDISLHNMEEVVNVSGEITNFCRDRGIDHRRANLAGLFLEEMAGNVVLHGFTKDRRSHSLDLRAVHKDGRIVLRIKDDCIPFDPAERKKLFDPEDLTKNMGIRMVYDLAEDISYRNMLGLNVLTISL